MQDLLQKLLILCMYMWPYMLLAAAGLVMLILGIVRRGTARSKRIVLIVAGSIMMLPLIIVPLTGIYGLLGTLYLMMFVMECWPYIFGAVGLVLLIIGIARRVRKETNKNAFIITGSVLLVPLLCVGIFKIGDAVSNYNSISHQMMYGSAGDMERLLKKGADPNCHIWRIENIPAEEGKHTLLTYLCYQNSSIDDGTEKVRLLIEYGAEVDWRSCTYCTDLHGQYLCRTTPLMFLCLHVSPQSVDMAKVLLENGADVNAENYRGETALDMINGPSAVAGMMKELLLSYGARSGIAS